MLNLKLVIIMRLHSHISNSNAFYSDTEKVPVLYPRPSHTLLAVLQLIFTTFDWVIKAAVPRVTLTDHVSHLSPIAFVGVYQLFTDEYDMDLVRTTL